MVKAVESQGVTVQVTDGGSPTAFQTLSNITDFSGPGGQASVIDVSNLSSTRREKLMGLPDEGQFTLTLNWDPDDTVHQLLRTLRNNRSRAEFKITLTDTTPVTGIFFGYVLGVTLSGAVDQAIKAAVSIEIDGAITWA
jgi:hypothetical protein